MSQTLRSFELGQFDLASVFANMADVGVAFLMQAAAILGSVRDYLRADIHFAASLFERFSVAGNFVIWVFKLYAASWQLVVVSFGQYVRDWDT